MVNILYRWTLVTAFFLFTNLIFPQSPSVSQPIKMGISQPMRDMPLNTPKTIENWHNRIIPLRSSFKNDVIKVDKDASINEYDGPLGTSGITKNFDGVVSGGYAPPDPSGDVGPNHYVQMVNVQTQIWNKNGTSLAGPFNNSNFWAGLPGPWSGSNDGDPIVLYDEVADRWMVSQFALPNYPNGPFYMLIAVSTTPDPTGTYYQYAYSFANMPDYPKFGIWSDGYYMSANIFASGSGNYLGTYAAVFDRAAMIAGGTAAMIYFSNPSSTWSFLPSDCDGIFPPAGSPNYFLATYDGFGGGNSNLDVYEFHVDWATPANSTFTGPLLISTPSFSEPNAISQLGTTNTLDNLADRPMNRLQYRNFGSHQSMVVCQTVNAGSGRAGMRWWELQKTSGAWSIYQEGTYAPNDGLSRWMGSIAMDGSGNIALAYSTSSSTIHPDIRYTGRFSSDPPGSMTIAETVIYSGGGSQTGGLSRWGDYTQMVADPTAAGTFWYTNQYIPTNGSFNWKTRIAAFSFGPPCTVGLPSNPNPIDGASSVSVNLPQLSWTNGVDANQCEVWFGVSGGMIKVYDGILISSWTIPAPLNYNTSYKWQIVEKNAACSTNGATWTFTTELSPGIVFVENFNNLNCWTALGPLGTTNWSIQNTVNAGGTSPELRFNWSPQFNGLSKLESCDIPVLNNRNYTISLKHMLDFFTITAPTLGLGVSYDNGASYTSVWSFTPTSNVGPETIQASFVTPPVAANLNLILYCNGNSYNINYWYIDDIILNDDDYSVAINPTNVLAAPINGSQIDVSFTPDVNNNNVLVVWNLTGIFTVPSGLPPAVGQSFAGGTLLYNGTSSPVNHTGLNPLTTYYYKLFSYNGSAYSSGVTSSAATLSTLDFGINLLVYDNCANSVPLIFGTAPDATDCYDPGLDISAPPPPPVGAFDARFSSCGEHWFTDIRGTNLDVERIWDVLYQQADACNQVSLSWNPAQLPPVGYFHIVDPIYGNMVNVNMRTTNHYTDLLAIGHLQIKFNYQICSNYNVSGGWNMLSLPLDVSNNNYLTLFPNAVPGTLFGYSGGFISSEILGVGNGYWLKFPASEIATVCGSDRTESVINLATGWNIIGGPNCNVPLSSVLDPGGIIVPGTLYGYSGSYFSASSIDGTKAYWIKANASGTITINCNNVLAKLNKDLTIPEITLADFSRIEINDASKSNQTLYFNGKIDESVSIESFSMPPLSPKGSFDARLMGDYRLSESDEVSIQVQSSNYPIRITVTNPNNKEGNSYVIKEIANGVEAVSHTIVDGTEIVINNQNTSLLKISKQDALPTSYNLEQNYPNPFNPSTTIKFSVPKQTQLKLNLYNVLGELIRTISEGLYEAGYHQVTFNAENLPSGLYIYRLEGSEMMQSRKMLLLK